MARIKTLDELRKIRDEIDAAEKKVKIKVSMATCGIASGAKQIMQYMAEETKKQGIDAIVSQTGCMGYCYAEPTIKVSLPGKETTIFGYVEKEKAKEIIEKYIKHGELVDNIIPFNYRTVK